MVLGEKFWPSRAYKKSSIACVVVIFSFIRLYNTPCLLYCKRGEMLVKTIGYNHQHFHYKPNARRPQWPWVRQAIGHNV
jgi:hypothetical protein